jgi:hypothetical protein
MMTDIDKLDSPTVNFEEFVEMVTPRMTSRDTREEILKVTVRTYYAAMQLRPPSNSS